MTTLLEYISLGLLPDSPDCCLLAAVDEDGDFDPVLPAMVVTSEELSREGLEFWSDFRLVHDGGHEYEFFGMCSEICRSPGYREGPDLAETLIYYTNYRRGLLMMRRAYFCALEVNPDGPVDPEIEAGMIALTELELRRILGRDQP